MKKTQRCSKGRELNQARLKPNTVDRPVRTARTFVHHYNSTQYGRFAGVLFAAKRPSHNGMPTVLKISSKHDTRKSLVQHLCLHLAGI